MHLPASALSIGDNQPRDDGPRIVCTPDILFGKPRVAGTRISVAQVLDRLGVGYTMERLLYNFPTLTEQDVHACCAWASNLVELSADRKSA